MSAYSQTPRIRLAISLIATLAATACTFGNTFDPAEIPEPEPPPMPTEGTDADCSDGEDNDLDELIDCFDPDCVTTLDCFVRTPLVPDDACEPPSAAALIRDGFDPALFYGTWDLRDPDVPEEEMTEGGRLVLRCAGEDRPTGIGSKVRTTFGPDQPLTLDARVVMPDCAGCEVAVGLHTREEWSAKRGGRTLLGVTLTGDGQGGVEVSCRQEFEFLAPPGARIARPESGEIDVSIRVEAEGALEFVIAGRRPCAPSRVVEEAPAGRLFLQRPECEPGQPDIAVDDVFLAADPERPAPGCEGQLHPLLPDSFCKPDHIDNGGALMATPVQWSGGWLMLLTTLHKQGVDSHLDLGVASSDDGVTGWRLTDPSTPVVGDHTEDWVVLTAASDPRTDEVLAWATPKLGGEESDRTELLVADARTPHRWHRRGLVEHTPAHEREYEFVLPWHPGAVLYDQERGHWRAWFLAFYGDEAQVVVEATSEYGQVWELGSGPVLAPSHEGWDSEGVRVTGISQVGDRIRLWYTGRASDKRRCGDQRTLIELSVAAVDLRLVPEAD